MRDLVTNYWWVMLFVLGFAATLAWQWPVRGRRGKSAGSRLVGRWEAGLMALIRDRYRCTAEEGVQVRRRFGEWQADLDFGATPPLALGPDDRPLLTDYELRVLDSCAHPEWAEEAAQRAAEELRLSNLNAGALASTLESDGLTCPRCHKHTADIRFVDHPSAGRSYFVCRLCGRSFIPADLEKPD